jgi:hypothetical protein
MNQYEEGVDSGNTRLSHKMRPSYRLQAHHINDNFTNMGYNYIGHILKNGTSPELWSNPQQVGMFAQLESMITYVLEEAKMVKKWFSIAHDKKTTRVN